MQKFPLAYEDVDLLFDPIKHVYDDTLTSDPLIAYIDFGADYSSSNGTFTIAWNASGIFTIDLTP